MHAPIKEIQPCQLGQAYVRFDYVHNRDRLANMGFFLHEDLEFRVAQAQSRKELGCS